jgi:hypothetical protein
MKASHACTFAMLMTLAACSGKHRPFLDTPIEASGGALPTAQEGDEATGPGSEAEPIATGGEPLGGVAVGTLSPPDNAIQSSGRLACEADAGACTVSDAGAVPAGCIPTGPRDCSSDLDNDCDGQPDNVVDDVCICLPASIEACDEHPGLDGSGQCRAGSRTCIVGADGVTSEWGECEGAVGPGEQDSCVDGDDTDCDGIPNEGCSCVDGVTQPCGSTTNTGPCQIGTSTCVDGRFSQCVGAVPPAPRDSCASRNDDSNCNGIPFEGCSCASGETQQCGTTDTGACVLGTRTCANGQFGQCVGAVNPAARDCRSQQDNDCDSRADNTRDNVCQCAIGSTQTCQTHPGQDGIGRCSAGSQTCVAGAGNSSSNFGNCTGSVGPIARDCRSQQDNDCDGRPDNMRDNVCTCTIGQTQPCQQHPQDGVGRCRAGSQTCVAGNNNSSTLFGACNGSVGPAQRDACTSVNDDDCDGLTNDGCQCVSSRGNADCSGNPDASRCNGATGQCVACQGNADCSLVSGGRNLCQAGRCVSPIRPLGESCTVGTQCESGVCDPFYRDNDRDGFAPQGAVAESFCSAVGFTKTQYTRVAPTNIRNTDCLDTAIDVSPSQAAFFADPASNGSYDYNCNGVVERQSFTIVNDDTCFADGADGVCNANGIAEDVGCGEIMVATNCINQGPSTCRLFVADGIGARRCK